MTKAPTYLTTNLDRIASLECQDLGSWSAKYDNPVYQKFPEYAEFKERFPQKTINRQDVTNLFANGEIYQGFIAAMVWGGINASRPRGREKGLTTTDFYSVLKYPKRKVIEAIKAAEESISKRDFAKAFDSFMPKAKYKIPGVGHPYFTKLFFFVGHANSAIEIKPLIFDKWTQNAFYALLYQSHPVEVDYFYRGLRPPTKKGNPGEALVRSGKKLTESYTRYVHLMNEWATHLKVSPNDLELFVFGKDLRKDPNANNPRRELWQICISANGSS